MGYLTRVARILELARETNLWNSIQKETVGLETWAIVHVIDLRLILMRKKLSLSLIMQE